MTRYIQTSDEVIDTKTDLIWQAKSLGPMTWHEAAALKIEGWRLPTIEELVTLIDYEKHTPASEFPGMEPEKFWSSSPYASYYDYAWHVYFGHGYVNYDYKLNSYRVRLVRAGQCSGIDPAAKINAATEAYARKCGDLREEIIDLKTEINIRASEIDQIAGLLNIDNNASAIFAKIEDLLAAKATQINTANKLLTTGQELESAQRKIREAEQVLREIYGSDRCDKCGYLFRESEHSGCVRRKKNAAPVKIDDGGHAFQLIVDDKFIIPGMALRDYFAGQALIGELHAQSPDTGHYNSHDALADACYRIADAMICRRQK